MAEATYSYRARPPEPELTMEQVLGDPLLTEFHRAGIFLDDEYDGDRKRLRAPDGRWIPEPIYRGILRGVIEPPEA